MIRISYTISKGSEELIPEEIEREGEMKNINKLLEQIVKNVIEIILKRMK